MTLPPLEYLLTCSKKSLDDLELAALDRSSQCLKRAKAEWDEAVAQREAAGVVRWMMENREAILEQARKAIDTKVVTVFPEARKTA